MANIPIIHSTVKSDYGGSGSPSASQELIASDWNAPHFTLSAGTGITITTDGGTPPTLTFTVSTSTFGTSLFPNTDNAFDLGSVSVPLRWRSGYFGTIVSGGDVFVNNVTAKTLTLLQPAGSAGAVVFGTGVGFSLDSNGQIQLDGCPDLRTSGDQCTDIGTSLKRIGTLSVVNVANTGADASGLTFKTGSYNIVIVDSTTAGALRPDVFHSGLVDIGSVGTTFKNGYFSGSVSAGGGFKTNSTSTFVGINPVVGFAYDFGTSLLPWRNAYFGQFNTVSFVDASGNTFLSVGNEQLRIREVATDTQNSVVVTNADSAPSISGQTGPGLYLGPGGSSAVDVGILRTAANTLRAMASSGFFTSGVTSAASGFQTNSTSTLASIFPVTDNTQDLGTNTSARWRNIYLAGIASAGAGFQTLGTSVLGSIIPGIDQVATLGSTGSRYNIIYSMVFKTVGADMILDPTGGAVRPFQDANGGFGTTSFRWTQMYASTALKIIGASGDSQATSSLESQILRFGVGGASVPDVSIGRTAANTITHTATSSLFTGVVSAGTGFQSNAPLIVYNIRGRQTGQTGAIATLASGGVGATDGTFEAFGNINVTTFVAGSFNMTVAYKDETGANQTVDLTFSTVTGTLGIAVGAGGAFEGIPACFRAKAGTSIVVSTSGTFTSLTYNAEVTITQRAAT